MATAPLRRPQPGADARLWTASPGVAIDGGRIAYRTRSVARYTGAWHVWKARDRDNMGQECAGCLRDPLVTGNVCAVAVVVPRTSI